ncbi:MAG: hypothetical protein JXR91_16910 [Deltaproteobacteria bacterium]|nr:hypothetical protein [Deltaproteobacteria bacterium]
MNFLHTAVILVSQTEVAKTPSDASFELSIWKWVIIVSVSAFVAIFAIKRIGDIAAKRKTEMIIEDIVGKGESAKATQWVEDEDDEDDDDYDEEENDNK